MSKRAGRELQSMLLRDSSIFLKRGNKEEYGVKNSKKRKNTPFISQGGTTLEEPTNNINKESDLEETKVVKEVEENI
ncbi:hypothetical protein CWI39_0240p0030 [Hamiltosporidium magnivora]|uniref:Uncharacterized protein n=1 Tax=Hamiltosporidium magnivora TaxID=148818 RepID=A0A4Q9LIJ7_9MICR|nr:hypothetical protein CWI39_0240p0030 [Hamiltosporidium magnivora]